MERWAASSEVRYRPVADILLPSRLREGSGVGQQRCDEPTPLRLASKLASLAAPPASERGYQLAAATSAPHPKPDIAFK